jgi:hypothetical protein
MRLPSVTTITWLGYYIHDGLKNYAHLDVVVLPVVDHGGHVTFVSAGKVHTAAARKHGAELRTNVVISRVNISSTRQSMREIGA